MQVSFEPDAKVAEMGAAYALDAVNFARDHLQVSLDFSDASIAQVEAILDRLHRDMTKTTPPPAPEHIFTFAKMLGSYVGETYRRNHGAEWGVVTLDGDVLPGLRKSNGGLFWPWGKADNRIQNGAQDNVAHYYAALLEPV